SAGKNLNPQRSSDDSSNSLPSSPNRMNPRHPCRSLHRYSRLLHSSAGRPRKRQWSNLPDKIAARQRHPHPWSNNLRISSRLRSSAGKNLNPQRSSHDRSNSLQSSPNRMNPRRRYRGLRRCSRLLHSSVGRPRKRQWSSVSK
ncbi:MAG: hypothetical protein Q7U02_09545, partial [Desulfosalsimonadaceae bacterium]|nr:hypothetical protein [Desulfosalsimonadaceae bacterium]